MPNLSSCSNSSVFPLRRRIYPTQPTFYSLGRTPYAQPTVLQHFTPRKATFCLHWDPSIHLNTNRCEGADLNTESTVPSIYKFSDEIHFPWHVRTRIPELKNRFSPTRTYWSLTTVPADQKRQRFSPNYKNTTTTTFDNLRRPSIMQILQVEVKLWSL